MWRRGAEVGVALVVGAFAGALVHAVEHRSPDGRAEVAGVSEWRSAEEPTRGPDAATLEGASASVVAIEVDGCGRRRQATATLLRVPGVGVVAVTNAHVVRGAAAAQLVAPDGTRHDATVRGAVQGRDLALVVPASTPSEAQQVLPDRDRRPAAAVGALEVGPVAQVGDRVGVVAYPGGRLEASAGSVRSTELRSAFGGTSQVLLVDVDALPGSSGGAVVDEAGRLVGVVAARDPSTGMSVAHPVGQLLSGAVVAAPGC